MFFKFGNLGQTCKLCFNGYIQVKETWKHLLSFLSFGQLMIKYWETEKRSGLKFKNLYEYTAHVGEVTIYPYQIYKIISNKNHWHVLFSPHVPIFSIIARRLQYPVHPYSLRDVSACLWADLSCLHTWPWIWPCVIIARCLWFFLGMIMGCVWSCVWFKPPLGWKRSSDRLMAESQCLWDSCVKLSVWWRDNCKVELTVSFYFWMASLLTISPPCVSCSPIWLLCFIALMSHQRH